MKILIAAILGLFISNSGYAGDQSGIEFYECDGTIEMVEDFINTYEYGNVDDPEMDQVKALHVMLDKYRDQLKSGKKTTIKVCPGYDEEGDLVEITVTDWGKWNPVDECEISRINAGEYEVFCF